MGFASGAFGRLLSGICRFLVIKVKFPGDIGPGSIRILVFFGIFLPVPNSGGISVEYWVIKVLFIEG
jgi:hypothetical protein